MALQTNGPISLSNVAQEFGGENPASLAEYYGVDDGIPSSGVISLGDFYGASAEGEPGPDPDPTLPPRYTSVGSGTIALDLSTTISFPTTYETFYYQITSPESGPVNMGLLTSGYYRAVPPVSSSAYVGVANNDFNRIAMRGVNEWNFEDYSNFELTIKTTSNFESLFYVSNPIWSYMVRGDESLSYLSGGTVTGPGMDLWPYGSGAVSIGQALASNIDGNGTCNITINWLS